MKVDYAGKIIWIWEAKFDEKSNITLSCFFFQFKALFKPSYVV